MIGMIGAPFALRAMGTPDNIMDYSLTYMIVYFIGMIPTLIYNVGSGILRAVGDSRRPMFFLIACCLVNVVLDLLFVAVFHWGVFGAALATCLAQFFSGILVILSLMQSEDERCRLQLKKIRIHPALLKSIVMIGIPAGLQSVMYSLSNIVIQTSVNSFGTTTIAAYTAYGKIDGIFWMIMSAFGVAVTTFVGQNFGAGKIDRVHKSVRVSLGLSALTAVVMSAVLMLTGQWVYQLFTQDEQVIRIGMQMLLYLAPYYVTYVCVEILSGAVRGTGDSLIPTMMTLLGICVLRVLWILIAVPMNHTIENVLFSYPLTWSITSVLFILYYLQGGWLKRQLRRRAVTVQKAQ